MEDYSRGLRGRVGNAVGVLKRAWVRIPCLPFSFKKDTQEMYCPQKVRQLIYPKDLVLYCTGLSPFSFTLIRLLL